MKTQIKFLACLAAATATCLSTVALAHISVDGPGIAGARQVLTFSAGHGCEGADSYRFEVAIPAEVTSVRAIVGAWGEAELTVDETTGAVTRVAWEKDTVRDSDDQYYQQAIRIRVPDMPFAKLYFATRQYCRTSDGVETVVDWDGGPGDDGEPAPALLVLPSRRAGWNKYVAPAAIDDLSVFSDAQIVWVGNAAFSANPVTKELIDQESDVEPLAAISAGAEIWVKY